MYYKRLRSPRSAQRNIVDGDPQRNLSCDIIRYGKSAIPVILTSVRGESYRRSVACRTAFWVVPRLTLQEQAMDAYLSAMWRRKLRHNIAHRQSTNDVRPSQRNLAGHTTTYQAIASNNQLLIDEFSRKNYLLTISRHTTWLRAANTTWRSARWLMLGMHSRCCKAERCTARQHEAIAFLPYTQHARPACR